MHKFELINHKLLNINEKNFSKNEHNECICCICLDVLNNDNKLT